MTERPMETDPITSRLENITDEIWALTKDRPNPALTWLNERSEPLPDGYKVLVAYTNLSSPLSTASVTLEIPGGGKIIKSWDKQNPGDKSKHKTSIPEKHIPSGGVKQVEVPAGFNDDDLGWIDEQLAHFRQKEEDGNGQA